MEEWSGRREALPEVLKDCVHDVNFYLLDGLPESPSEVSYGSSSCFIIVCKELIFLFYRTEQRY